MEQRRILRLLAAAGLFLALPTGLSRSQELIRREISSAKIKELKATIDLSFGQLTLRRCPSDKIAVVEYTKPEDQKHDLEINYERSVDGVGTLMIRSEEESGFWKSGSHENDREWMIELTDQVPMSLRCKLGAGEGTLDLTGLQLRTLKISTGASTVRLTCDELNPIDAETVEIESGVSRLTAHNLCNTNFDRMKFSGGVGSYALDFGGTLTKDAQVIIEVGLGAVTVSLPEDLPARIKHDDSWFSSFDLDHEFVKKSKGVYESATYGVSGQRLVIAIESGLGSVEVRHR